MLFLILFILFYFNFVKSALGELITESQFWKTIIFLSVTSLFELSIEFILLFS